MLFRDESQVPTTGRSQGEADGFTFARADGVYEARVWANADRAVDLFYALCEHVPATVDVYVADLRTETRWRGEGLALADVRDAIGRLKTRLAMYGGVEISVYTGDDQLTLSGQLDLYAFSRTDRWMYLVQARGLEVLPEAEGSTGRIVRWDRTSAPMLSSAVEAAAERLGLVADGGA